MIPDDTACYWIMGALLGTI